MQSFIKNEKLQMIVIAMVTAVGAGFKINPFNGDFFRIGLGVSTFLCFLLFMHHLSYVKTGIITGIINALLQDSLAAGFYYFVFALGMSRIKNKTNQFQPLLLGGIVSAIDFVSNIAELLIRGVLLGTYTFHFDEWFLLMIIAVIRSYFVIGLYSSISVSQMRLLHTEQEKRMEQMLNVNSGLYGEVFYLRKSMDTIEQITANSFDLYSKLKEENLVGYSRQALGVAQQIHEVKKDSQRILAGLLKLFDNAIVVEMDLVEMLHFVKKGNQEYSEMLQKTIVIENEVTANYVTPHYIPILTVLNNLVSNAVEAIDQNGTINIQVIEEEQEIVFIVSDSGKGIAGQERQIIFEPGFTTKFNEVGIAATGIGLSHVRDIVHSFGGLVEVGSSEETIGAKFVVRLPITSLKKGDGEDVAFFRYSG
jgi:two-component system sensor histidine kinase YcbA